MSHGTARLVAFSKATKPWNFQMRERIISNNLCRYFPSILRRRAPRVSMYFAKRVVSELSAVFKAQTIGVMPFLSFLLPASFRPSSPPSLSHTHVCVCVHPGASLDSLRLPSHAGGRDSRRDSRTHRVLSLLRTTGQCNGHLCSRST